MEEGICDADRFAQLDRKAKMKIDAAVAFAEAGEPADTRLVFDLMFVEPKA